jgi:hypothetical protein
VAFKRNTGYPDLRVITYMNLTHTFSSPFQNFERFVVKLLILIRVCNIVLLDFRFPVYQVCCRHFESAFYEEVKLYACSKMIESLNVTTSKSELDKVSCVCGASCKNLECELMT